jgi:hypothetical protein
MSNLQLIEALCHLVERQAEVISILSMTLAEAGVSSQQIDDMIADARDQYSAILGADEAPD